MQGDPASRDAHVNLPEPPEMQGEGTGAERDFHEALRIGPNSAPHLRRREVYPEVPRRGHEFRGPSSKTPRTPSTSIGVVRGSGRSGKTVPITRDGLSPKLFVICNRRDAAGVEAVASELRKAGIEVFFARSPRCQNVWSWPLPGVRLFLPVGRVLANRTAQRLLAEEDHPVEALRFDGTYESLGPFGPIRRSRREANGLGAGIPQQRAERRRERGVAVHEAEPLFAEEAIDRIGETPPDLVAKCHFPSDPLFPGPGGKNVGWGARHAFAGAFRASKLTYGRGRPDIWFHSLRRTAPTLALNAGVPEAVVQKLGNWKDRQW